MKKKKKKRQNSRKLRAPDAISSDRSTKMTEALMVLSLLVAPKFRRLIFAIGKLAISRPTQREKSPTEKT